MTKPTKLQTALKAHQSGEREFAEQQYKALMIEDPDCLDACHLLAILYAEQKKYLLAQPLFENLLTHSPQDPTVYYHLGLCYYHLNNISAALTVLTQAVALSPEYVEAYHALGKVYEATHDAGAAKTAYDKALAIKPNDVDALLHLSLWHLRQGQKEEARAGFRTVLGYMPDNPIARFQLGNIAYQAKEIDEAYDYYASLPEDEDALLNAAVILLEKGEKQDAVFQFQAILARNPKNLLAHNNLASIYVIDKDYDQAITHYHAILMQDHAHYTAHFNLGAIYMAQKKWETAAYHLSIAVKEHPHDPDAHDNYATVLLKLNNEALAETHYLKALALRPDDPIASYRLAALTGKAQPQTAPSFYIQSLFDNYAEHFDHELMDALQYKVPEALYKAASAYFYDRWDLHIIDLGCGTGLCGRYFLPRAERLIGVDLSKNMLALAEKKHIYDLLKQEDMTVALDEWTAEIDLILAADSFVYVGDLAPLLQACFRALKPSGYLLFTVERTRHETYFLNKSGRYGHNETALRHLTQSTGFKMDCCQSMILRQEKGEPVHGWLIGLVKR